MPKLSRRAFAREAVVAATAAAVLPNVLAQAPPPAPAPPVPEVEARINWIFTKYGAHLDDAQRADIRRILAGGQKDIDAMRAWPISNSVEPAAPFRIYRRRS
jgi:hypothetical protein